MEELKFRTLTADEIECRVAQVGKSTNGYWCSLLLYKDARCDQRLLDETVGCFRWKREHELINGNLFCTVSIKDDEGEWVSKQDVGTESNTEKEKGQASDAFKRACFNWGLGRELYTSPKIFVTLANEEVIDQQGKQKVSPRVSFNVSSISYDAKRNISALVITDSKGTQRFVYSGTQKAATKKTQKAAEKPVASGTEQPKQMTNVQTAKPVVEQQNLSLEEAKVLIAQATVREQLAKIFNSNMHLQANKEFISAMRERKNQILNSNGTAAA